MNTKKTLENSPNYRRKKNRVQNNEYIKRITISNKYAKHYYELDNPIASDSEYDDLYKQVLAYEESNPDKISKDSPTRKVGATTLKDFSKNKHIKRMWSLDDIFNEKDLSNWLNKLNNAIAKTQVNTLFNNTDSNDTYFCISPKYDGMSLNLLYKNGKLHTATTRGDGEIGEIVTQNALTIKNIPKTIPFKYDIEIRGEVVLSKQNFDKLNQERESTNQPLFANPRNAAAGSMRQLDSKLTEQRNLDFVVWGIGHCENIQALENYTDKKNLNFYNILCITEKFGFAKHRYINLVKACDIEKEYQKILKDRDSYEFMLDGFVIVVDDLALQDTLGFTQKSPRFACAYKFPATEVTIQIESITPQVGRTGIITPVANFKPTLLEGAYISRATLHNYKEIELKDIRIKDYCLLVRSGDVIPKITKVLKERRTNNEVIITKPTLCPICNHNLSYEDIYIYCNNPNCDAIIKASLTHFASKKCMNIDGLGESIINLLVDSKLIKEYKDIYSLSKDDLLKLEGFKDKKAQNLINAITNSVNNREFWRFIHSLGILHIGEVASKKLASYGDCIFDYTIEQLIEIDGFGKDLASSFYHFCINNKEFIQELKDIIKPQITITTDIQRDTNSPFYNKVCVITGSFDIPRDEIKQMLESYGAKVASSVSSKTDILIAGDKAGSKLEKAKELDIEIMSLNEVREQLT